MASFCVKTRRSSVRGLHTWLWFTRWQDIVAKKRKFDAYSERARVYFDNGMYWTIDNPAQVLDRDKPKEYRTREERGTFPFNFIAKQTMLRYVDLSFDAILRKKRYEELVLAQYDQRFLPERLLALGPDLAAAHFLVARDAAIKFVGDDTWYRKNQMRQYKLPGRRIPGLHLEAIDASGTKLLFEGFDNLIHLKHLRLLHLANCDYINDWCMSKMYQFADSLEFLDLSHCTRLSPKGISGLACLKKLKYLRLEGLENVKGLGKAALMLEDAIPGLEVVGVDYGTAAADLEAEIRLLAHPRVFQDARGNAHLWDEYGDCFYLSGCVPERPVVDEEDLPLIKNRVLPDPPELPLDELEEVDRLSRGKLKHLLVGSPSGISRKEETERTLRVRANRLLKKGAQVHPFLLPEEKKQLKGIQSDADGNRNPLIQENDRLNELIKS